MLLDLRTLNSVFGFIYQVILFFSKRTLALLLSHDGVAEGQEPEEALNLRDPQLHRLHQRVVVEGELGVGHGVEGEVHHLSVLGGRDRTGTCQ